MIEAPLRCRANRAHMKQPKRDSGPGFQVKVFQPFQVVPSLFAGGHLTPCAHPSRKTLPTPASLFTVPPPRPFPYTGGEQRWESETVHVLK